MPLMMYLDVKNLAIDYIVLYLLCMILCIITTLFLKLTEMDLLISNNQASIK